MQYPAEMPGLKDSQFDQEMFAQPVLEEEDLGKPTNWSGIPDRRWVGGLAPGNRGERELTNYTKCCPLGRDKRSPSFHFPLSIF